MIRGVELKKNFFRKPLKNQKKNGAIFYYFKLIHSKILKRNKVNTYAINELP